MSLGPPSRAPIRERLEAALHGARRCLVLTHDNPDPDALASAFTLRHLLEHGLGIAATVAFSGVIGRAENRAMIQALEMIPEPLSTLDVSGYDAVALVDSQPGTGNNSLPEGLRARIVIDHHPPKSGPVDADLADIRPDYGSTATILAEYAEEMGVRLPVNLSTALFYALKSETQDLGRETSEPDRGAYFRLLARADMRAVALIQRARVPREYFDAFRTAIDGAQVLGCIVITDLGVVPAPDMVAEIADFLLRLQEVEWSCAFGRHENTVIVSLRTSDPDAHAGQMIRGAVAGLGTAGGHGTMAGAQIPITDRNQDEVVARLRARILEALGEPGDDARPLVG